MQAGGASSPFTRPARLSQRTGTFRNVSDLQRCGQESVPHRQGSKGAVSQPPFWNRALREEGEEEWKARLQPDHRGHRNKEARWRRDPLSAGSASGVLCVVVT